jgi:hypothetical protein
VRRKIRINKFRRIVFASHQATLDPSCKTVKGFALVNVAKLPQNCGHD